MKISSGFLNADSPSYYDLANYVKPKNDEIKQYCTSNKCCSVYSSREYVSKLTGEVTKYEHLIHIKNKVIKNRTSNMKDLMTDCPDCGSALFTGK
jgi:hypothetical protein